MDNLVLTASMQISPFFLIDYKLIKQIEVGNVICEIERDKATLEFEFLEEGYYIFEKR